MCLHFHSALYMYGGRCWSINRTPRLDGSDVNLETLGIFFRFKLFIFQIHDAISTKKYDEEKRKKVKSLYLCFLHTNLFQI